MRSSCDVSLGYHNVDIFRSKFKKKKRSTCKFQSSNPDLMDSILERTCCLMSLETYEFIKILKKSMFSLSHFLQWNENLIDYRGGDVEEA